MNIRLVYNILCKKTILVEVHRICFNYNVQIPNYHQTYSVSNAYSKQLTSVNRFDVPYIIACFRSSVSGSGLYAFQTPDANSIITLQDNNRDLMEYISSLSQIFCTFILFKKMLKLFVGSKSSLLSSIRSSSFVRSNMQSTRSFTAAEPDYEKRVGESFQRQGFRGFIGAELTQVKPGFVEIQLPYQKGLTYIQRSSTLSLLTFFQMDEGNNMGSFMVVLSQL